MRYFEIAGLIQYNPPSTEVGQIPKQVERTRTVSAADDAVSRLIKNADTKKPRSPGTP